MNRWKLNLEKRDVPLLARQGAPLIVFEPFQRNGLGTLSHDEA